MSNLKVQLFGVDVSYDYLFLNKGEFQTPEFPLTITISNEEGWSKVVSDLTIHVEKYGFDYNFFKYLTYIAHNINFRRSAKLDRSTIHTVTENSGCSNDISLKVLIIVKVFCIQNINYLTQDEYNIFLDFAKNNTSCIKDLINDIPFLTSTTPARTVEIAKYLPTYDPNETLWDMKYAVKYQGNSVYAIRNFIKLTKWVKDKKSKMLPFFVRYYITNRLADNFRNSYILLYEYFRSPLLSKIFTKAKMKQIFSVDYNSGYKDSSILRMLHLHYGCEGMPFQNEISNILFAGDKPKNRLISIDSFIDQYKKERRPSLSLTLTAINIVETLAIDTCYQTYELLEEISKKDKEILPILRNIVLHHFNIEKSERVSIYNDAVANGYPKEKVNFVEYLINYYGKVEKFNLKDSFLERLPILNDPKNDFEKEIVKSIFSEDYKKIHGVSGYEFYKDMHSYLQKHNTFSESLNAFKDIKEVFPKIGRKVS